MNPKHALTLFFCASLCAAVPAHAKTVLPDACGDDKAQFDVKTEEGQSAPAPPPAGKAQIIFVDDDSVKTSGFSFTTFRYGMDGAWVGANKGNSYFVLNVDPGVHHLCMSPQTVSGRGRMTWASHLSPPKRTRSIILMPSFRSSGAQEEPTFPLRQARTAQRLRVDRWARADLQACRRSILCSWTTIRVNTASKPGS
jgi:hypothetical protein